MFRNEGRGLFWWNVPTKPEAIQDGIDVVKACRADTVALKIVDGIEPYNDLHALLMADYWLRQDARCSVGGWTYHRVGENPHDQAIMACERVAALELDYLILDMEDDSRDTPAMVLKACVSYLKAFDDIAEGDCPIVVCTHAQPRFHHGIPYLYIQHHGIPIMPMAYHTAMEMQPQDAIDVTYRGLAELGLGPQDIIPAEGVYPAGIPLNPGSVTEWGDAAVKQGAQSLWFFSVDELLKRPEFTEEIVNIAMTGDVPF